MPTLQEKWDSSINHPDLAPIEDAHKRAVVAQVMENMEVEGQKERSIMEGGMATSAVDNHDPVLIALVRRSVPNIIAYDIAGVQAMTMPTGQIFAMKSKYLTGSAGSASKGDEALYAKPDTAFSGDQVAADGSPMSTAQAEALKGSRDDDATNGFGEMGFEIVKATVTAQSRALRAEYTIELAQDLKAVHGMDAENELANILSTEIIAEMNREVIDGVNDAARLGGSGDDGTYDLDADNEGRWELEQFRMLVYQIEKEANAVAIATRRGRANFAIVSSNVASALSAAGMLNHNPAIQTKMQVDPTGNLFAGVLNTNIKVYIDPFAMTDYITVGFRGAHQYDAGVFYCPYVPLTMLRATGEDTFNPRIGFKTRYGMRANPFVDYPRDGYPEGPYGDRFGGTGNNQYFRRFTVAGI